MPTRSSLATPVANLWQRRHWVRGQGRLPGDWPVTPAPWPDTAEPAPQRSGRGELRAHEGDPRGASLLIFGLLQFVSTFTITTAYVWFADKHLDPISGPIREQVEGAAR